jgi:hypothetical protein
MTGTRLNDCTPTPDERAKYGADAEREAQKPLLSNALDDFHATRCGHNYPFADCPWENCLGRENARLLNEARAEIARLRAPPAADVMEIARVALGYTADPAWIINDPQRFPDVHAVARALTTYGDQRARDARQQILVDSTPLREAVAHEARAAAWAEAILMVDDETHITHNFPAPPIIAKMRERALAAAPPQSEERHLTPDEQRVMQKALLRSTRIIDDPPQSEGGEG